MTEHTPTPWHWIDAYSGAHIVTPSIHDDLAGIKAGPEEVLSLLASDEQPACLDISVADADFLLRAVNAHDALLAACKALVADCNYEHDDMCSTHRVSSAQCDCHIGQARAAIAKAEGQSEGNHGTT